MRKRESISYTVLIRIPITYNVQRAAMYRLGNTRSRRYKHWCQATLSPAYVTPCGSAGWKQKNVPAIRILKEAKKYSAVQVEVSQNGRVTWSARRVCWHGTAVGPPFCHLSSLYCLHAFCLSTTCGKKPLRYMIYTKASNFYSALTE